MNTETTFVFQGKMTLQLRATTQVDIFVSKVAGTSALYNQIQT